MHIIYYSDMGVERFNTQVDNLIQLLDYLKVNKPEIAKEVATKELSYTVYDKDKEKAYPILGSMLDYDISEYELLVIAPKVSGEAFFTTIAAGVTSAIAATAVATAAEVAIGYAVATIVTVGLIIALGMLIRSLSPQNKLDNNTDPSQMSKLFNGVPNITEQGGSVPVVFGNCLYGGVRIGLKFEVALDTYNDVLGIADFPSASGIPSTWLKIL